MEGKFRRRMIRRIEVVEDLRAREADQRFQAAASLLDPLSAPMLVQFRREVRICYQNRAPRFLCANCKKPVYVSLSGAIHTEQRDGRDAFFAHHAGTAEDCEWGTGGEDPREINRLKYGGATESVQHQRLKSMLATMLEADQAFNDIQIEHVISRPPHWRKPDVTATFLSKLIAFDLQLATTQLPDIVARENFYEQHNIRYVWVTNSDDAQNLARQAFQDIYWSNNAQIFGLDEHANSASVESGELHLWALSVRPRFDASGLRAVWERQLVRRSDIDWHTQSGRPWYPGENFDDAVSKIIESRFTGPRKRLIIAARHPESDTSLKAGRAWDEIAGAVGAPLWADAQLHRPFKAIGVLSTAAAGKKMDATKFAPQDFTSIFNNFLEAKSCRGWTAALVHIARVYENLDLLEAASTKKKIARNLAEEHPDLMRHYTAMLDIIFPKSARSRLTGSPTEIVEV